MSCNFAPRALPRFLATTSPSATLSPSADFPGSPVIRPTWLRRFRDGTRRASPVARRVLVTVLSLSPRRRSPPRRPACDGPCCLRPPVAGSASGASHFRGHLCVHSRYGPVTRSPSRGGLRRWASGHSVSLLPAIQATGRLAVAPVGLTPTEHVSLWTHLFFAKTPPSGGQVVDLYQLCISWDNIPDLSRSTSSPCPPPASVPARCAGQELRLLVLPELTSPPASLIR